MSKNKKYTVLLLSVLLFFVANIFMDKIFGHSYQANLYETPPLEWSEILETMPQYFVYSIVFGIFIYILLHQIEKNKKKNR
jgi:hypothetical protein